MVGNIRVVAQRAARHPGLGMGNSRFKFSNQYVLNYLREKLNVPLWVPGHALLYNISSALLPLPSIFAGGTGVHRSHGPDRNDPETTFYIRIMAPVASIQTRESRSTVGNLLYVPLLCQL